MRILCLTPWFPAHRLDQTGNFILDSIESLIQLGHEVVVLVSEPWRPIGAQFINKNWAKKKIHQEEFSNKIKLTRCHYFSIPRSYFCSFSHWSYRKRINPILENLIQNWHPQIIHAHTELPGVAAIDTGKKLGIPTIVTLHGITIDQKLLTGKNRKVLFEYTLENADRVVLVGEPLIPFTKVFVKDQSHFRVVNNGFRPHVYNFHSTKKICKNKSLNFISVSNLQKGKAVDINLYAFSKLNKLGITNWTYKIIGDGCERRNLENLINKLNLNNQVQCLGKCNHNDVYTYLHQSDVFSLPSYREAFGVAYLEAMACGLLTIGVKGQGPQTFINHQKTGLLVPPHDIDALANIFQMIFTNRSRMQEIADAGKKHVHEEFTWECHAKNLSKVYNELVAE